MKSRQNTIIDKLKNIEILEDDYGIKIPDNELNQMNMDDELVRLYFMQKLQKEMTLKKWMTSATVLN